jgi:flagellar biosynthesis protein FlhA
VPKARVVTLDPSVERKILEGVKKSERGTYIALEPDVIEGIARSVNSEVSKLSAGGGPPVVLCSSAVRPYFRRLVDRLSPRVAVLAYEEIDASAELESAGMITI